MTKRTLKRPILKAMTVALTALVTGSALGEQPNQLRALPAGELGARLASDARAVATYRAGLARLVRLAADRPDLFPAAKLDGARALRREQREEIWGLWRAFLDYLLALDSVGTFYEDFWTLRGHSRDEAFAVRYATYLAQYRFSLDLIARAENDPGLDVVLNDPIPELGLPGRTYAALKLRFLNVQRAVEFAAFEALRHQSDLSRFADLAGGIEEDAGVVWHAGKGQGETLTLANALAVVKGAASHATFPVQAGVAEWMGDQKVHRKHVNLVTPAQIRALQPRLRPGDILLERREWYLSNIGLPGYWPHAALYVGTPAERTAFLATPEVTVWVKGQGQVDGSFEALLAAREPAAATASRGLENGHPVRILEAMSEGVVFTSIEHSAAADSLAVLRPRLPAPAKAAAILQAFHYAGRPYDYNFDFLTDATLVCTELVFKAYEPKADQPGLRLLVDQVMGRLTMPANLLAKLYDSEAGTDTRQLDLVLFLDGHEATRTAREADETAFRESWKRPKWFILAQP